MKAIDPSGKHLHFVTGRLAESPLRDVLSGVSGSAGGAGPCSSAASCCVIWGTSGNDPKPSLLLS